ncbi:MAG: putative integrase, partial [Gammaproteobacteria bacterium]|nr:putative integrase [Gammaproteobacteria bacterium]
GRTETLGVSTCCAHPLGAIEGHNLVLPPSDSAQTVFEPLERRPLFLGVVVAVVDLCDVIDRVIEQLLDVKSGDTGCRHQASRTERFWKRRNATFSDLWNKFEAQLAGPVPGPATIADYKSMGRLYLLPLMGDRLLSEIDGEFLVGVKTRLLTEPGVKAAAAKGSGKPLAPRTVAKILTLIGTVFRFGKVLKDVADNPAADVKKPRAAKKTVYILEREEIARLRAALDVPSERLLVELTITTGLRSSEIRGLVWDSIDLEGKRLFVEHQATRRRADDTTKTESSVRTVPVPGYLIPELKRWKLACPPTARGLVFPGELDATGERGPIDSDKLLRNILRRALRRAGLPPLRFHDMRHLAGTLMSEAGVPPRRAQEILGHADVRTTLAIYTHAMKRRHDDSADKMAELAGLTAAGNKRETSSSVKNEESELSACFNGSPGWNRTNDQRINSPTLYR